jgi:hypothetical protein
LEQLRGDHRFQFSVFRQGESLASGVSGGAVNRRATRFSTEI